ncbi:MAG: hypothetical protein HY556_07040 [Euryarchaeota archaeon]|nr:hypothetical protein [Euryarchaeota archaeon]
MARDTAPVSAAGAEKILAKIVGVLPDGWTLMPIGGTLMPRLGLTTRTVTKDVDLVVLALRDGVYVVPEVEALVAVARRVALSDDIHVRKDHDVVEFVVEVEGAPAKVEFVRGRGPKGGYFVRRNILETAAKLAKRHDRILDLPPEALAFLKAWAAHDKEKLVLKEKDKRGYHAQRATQFRADVGAILHGTLDAGHRPHAEIIRRLLDACGAERRKAIETILQDSGWPV